MPAKEKPPNLGKLHISIPLLLNVDAEGMPAIIVFFVLVIALIILAYLLHGSVAAVLVEVFGNHIPT